MPVLSSRQSEEVEGTSRTFRTWPAACGAHAAHVRQTPDSNIITCNIQQIKHLTTFILLHNTCRNVRCVKHYFEDDVCTAQILLKSPCEQHTIIQVLENIDV